MQFHAFLLISRLHLFQTVYNHLFIIVSALLELEILNMFSLFISITSILLVFSFKSPFFIQGLPSSYYKDFLVGIMSWHAAEDT